MLLFTTVLQIKKNITKEAFIQLVIEWNQNNPHEENIIPNIVWNGEKHIRFGNDSLWMEIVEDDVRNTIAIRYEKITEDGITWDTDYVMNFNRMEIAIRLDRSYREDALVGNGIFSSPYFITFLIKKEFLQDDHGIKIDRYPHKITNENNYLYTDVMSGKTKYHLPMIYISRTEDDQEPVDAGLLASRLKGVAHVMVQDIRQTNEETKDPNCDWNIWDGDIGIYYPNEHLGYKVYSFNGVDGRDNALEERIIKDVLQYGNLQKLDVLYTWQGISNAILNEDLERQIVERRKVESEKEKSENELLAVYDSLDDELKEMQKKIKELTNRNEALSYENQRLLAKASAVNGQPILMQGTGREFYPGETKDYVLSVLCAEAANAEAGTRKKELLTDVVNSNEYEHISEKKRQKLKQILKGYKNVSAAMKQELVNLGFEITEEGKHYKLTYYGDERYLLTLAKTPSDHRSGDNIIGTISRKVF